MCSPLEARGPSLYGINAHAFHQEFVLPAAECCVWDLLTCPSQYAQWCSAVTVKTKDSSTVSQLTSGSTWLESHHGALFLRPWLDVRVLSIDPNQRSMSLCLDDGCNHIQQQLTVMPHPNQPDTSHVSARLECYQHTAKGLVPCEKLAVMFKKADKRLANLAAFLQANTAADATATALIGLSASLVPV
jgi:hypothetical protein